MKKLYHSELGVPVFLKSNRPSQQFPRAYTQGSFWEEMYIVSLKGYHSSQLFSKALGDSTLLTNYVLGSLKC